MTTGSDHYPDPVVTPKPTLEELEAFADEYKARGGIPKFEREPWCVAAISAQGQVYWGAGNTAAYAKAFAWAATHHPKGVATSEPVPDEWTFVLYAPRHAPAAEVCLFGRELTDEEWQEVDRLAEINRIAWQRRRHRT